MSLSAPVRPRRLDCAAVRGHRLASFTLVELMTVLAISSILAVVSVSAYMSILRSQDIMSGAQLLAGQLDFARQAAITHDCRVEFRLYQLPDYPASTSSTPKVYRAFQTFLLNGNSTNALTRVTFLSSPLIVSDNTANTSLATLSTQPGSSFTLGSPDSSTAGTLPGFGANYNALVLDFTPTGGLEPQGTLTATSAWFMTLVIENDPIKSGTLPKNFATIQIDPFSGQTKTFRP